MKKFFIEDAAFNITNVCNLTCDGCESFNNYNFKGHMKFADYAKHYTQWSRLVSIDTITIHGGEPFTNPDILNWVIKLKQLWPTAQQYYVSTNGTFLKSKKDIAKKILNSDYYINICVHDPSMYEEIKNNLHSLLEDYDFYIKTNNQGNEYFELHTHKKLALLESTYYFKKSAIDFIKDKTWFMHDSNINDAYEICLEGSAPCNLFHKGYLYQCQLTALKDDLFLQFSIEPRAVDLLKKYRAGDPFSPKNELKEFFRKHNKPIPQCTLCPGCDQTHPIYPMAKKKEVF